MLLTGRSPHLRPGALGILHGQRDEHPLLALQHLYQHHLVPHPRMDQTCPRLASRETSGAWQVAFCHRKVVLEEVICRHLEKVARWRYCGEKVVPYIGEKTPMDTLGLFFHVTMLRWTSFQGHPHSRTMPSARPTVINAFLCWTDTAWTTKKHIFGCMSYMSRYEGRC